MLIPTSVLSLDRSAATVSHCFFPRNYGVISCLLFGVCPRSVSVHSVGFCASNLRGRIGLQLCAQKKRGKGRSGVMEMNDSGDDYGEEEDDVFDGFSDNDDDGEGEEDMPLPFREMKKWMANKPRGFGEGKMYDTSLEDDLLKEIEQSKEGLASNLSKLKNASKSPSNKQSSEKKALGVVKDGARVRVINLPKKKNIHRDLKSAFDGVPGIIHIIPAVEGNKKTRDPVCKGFAFVDFRSPGDATRFQQTFSNRSLTFGKIEKQIKCEMMNSGSSDSDQEQSADQTNNISQIHAIVEVEQIIDSDVDDDDSSLEHWEENSFDEFDDDDDDDIILSSNEEQEDQEQENIIMAEFEEIRESVKSKNEQSSNVSEGGNTGSRMETVIKPLSPKELERAQALERIRALEKRLLDKGKREKMFRETLPERENKQKAKPPKKKPDVKGNGDKTPKLDIPGSAKRLKVKEKALLTDVMSRYGDKAAKKKG